MGRHETQNGQFVPDAREAPNDRPSGRAVIVSVCTTCRSAAGDKDIGPRVLDAVKTALNASGSDAILRPVQCLGVCKRPATVAVSGADGYTFVFGDLDADSGPDAIASFVQSYRLAEHGFVPWRERAEPLRRGLVARIPPAGWSPDDGRPPK